MAQHSCSAKRRQSSTSWTRSGEGTDKSETHQCVGQVSAPRSWPTPRLARLISSILLILRLDHTMREHAETGFQRVVSRMWRWHAEPLHEFLAKHGAYDSGAPLLGSISLYSR